MLKRNIAIITARGGSKRLPNKNILELNGKPLIAWTIEAALKSDFVDDVYVSTDSIRIKEISEQFGACVPYIRPEFLSNDTASSVDVVEHMLNYLQKERNIIFDNFVLLQPTSPLRTSSDLDAAFELFNMKNANAVISVTETEHSPLWSNVLDDTLSLDNFISESVLGKRSQDLPKYYRLNGAIYICKVDEFLREKNFFISNKKFASVMLPEHSVDIDTKLDFLVADFLMKDNKDYA